MRKDERKNEGKPEKTADLPVYGFQIAAQQEGAVVGKGKDTVRDSDVGMAQFDAMGDVGIVSALYQGAQGFGMPVVGLYLYRNQTSGCPYKKIFLQGRILFLIVKQPVAAFDQSFRHDVFIQGTFVDSEMGVLPQILLGFFIKGSNQHSGIVKIQFVLGIIVVPFQRKFGKRECIAHVDDSGVLKPFNAAPVVLETCAGSHFGNLEFLVLFRQLDGNVVEYVQNACLVSTFGIFPYIFLIIR